MIITRVSLASLAVLSAASSTSFAQCISDLVPIEVETAPRGQALDLDGDRAAALLQPEFFGDHGSVHVLERRASDGVWERVQVIEPPPGAIQPFLGTAIAIDGDVMLVGDGEHRTQSNFKRGRVFAYERDTLTGVWNQVQQLSEPLQEHLRYGTSLALAGNRALIGVPQPAGLQPAAGWIDYYLRDEVSGQWSLRQRIRSSDFGLQRRIGLNLALDGDLLLAGAPETGLAGDVLALRRNPATDLFEFQQLLQPDAQHAPEDFGASLAVCGAWAVVGSAYGGVGAGAYGGFVYVYAIDPVTGVLTFHQYLSGNQFSGPEQFDRFGDGLALGDGFLLIGVPYWDANPNQPYYDEGLVLHVPMGAGGAFANQATTTLTGDRYEHELGGILAADGTRALALGRMSHFDLPDPIAAELFALDFDTTDCNNNGYPDLCDVRDQVSFDRNANGLPDECERVGTPYCSPAVVNSTGAPAVVRGVGSAVLGESLTLCAIGLPVGEFGYFLASSAPDLIVAPGNSVGNLCLAGGPDFGRYVHLVSQASGGEFCIPVDLDAIPVASGTSGLSAGETWYFQAWFRDGATSNFTDGLAVVAE